MVDRIFKILEKEDWFRNLAMDEQGALAVELLDFVTMDDSDETVLREAVNLARARN